MQIRPSVYIRKTIITHPTFLPAWLQPVYTAYPTEMTLIANLFVAYINTPNWNFNIV